MEPDLIPEHESRFQRSRLQQHHTSSVSVPLMENWMPQLVTDSRRKPTVLQTPPKMLPIRTQPVQSDSDASQRNSVTSYLEGKTCQSKYIGVQSLNGALKPRNIRKAPFKTDTCAQGPISNRKTRNVIEDERHLKKEVTSKVSLPAKQGKGTSLNVGNEVSYEANVTFSSNLPHYMKPLNRNVSNRTALVEQTKGKVQSQPSVRKKTFSNLSPVRIPDKEKELYSKTGLEASPYSHVKAIREQGRSVNLTNQRKAPILKAPPCSPDMHQNKQRLGEKESESFETPDFYLFPCTSNKSNEVMRQTSCQTDEKKDILESSQTNESRRKDVPTKLPLSQTGEDIADRKQIIEVTVTKTKKKAALVHPKRLSFVTKKSSVCTPLKSRPKTTKAIQSRPYRGAVADPLKGELPPNGNLQCKPEGMKNFISTIGMPFYGLPVSQTPQYSDTYLDMLDDAGITLRKAIRESVKMANKKLQDPKPWMPSRFACPPRKRPVSPREFTRRPRSPETMIWRLAKEDIIIDRNTNSKTTVPPVRGKTPAKKSQSPGLKKKIIREERKTRGEPVTVKKAAIESAVSDQIDGMDSSTKQTAAARILALMEKSVAPDQCSCNASKRVDSLVTQNVRLRQEVRQLERLVIERRHADKLRERSRMDANIKRNSS